MFTSKCLLLALTGLLAVKKAKWPFYYPKITGYSSLMFQGDLENLVEYFFYFFLNLVMIFQDKHIFICM